MPRLSVYFIRTALLYLAIGFTFGGLLLFHKGIPLDAQLWRLLPLHIELVFMGWIVQLAMGVAFWVLPRYKHGLPRGDERPVWAAYILLNAGIVGGAMSQWLAWSGEVVLASRLSVLLAVALFAVQVWARIKPTGA